MVYVKKEKLKRLNDFRAAIGIAELQGGKRKEGKLVGVSHVEVPTATWRLSGSSARLGIVYTRLNALLDTDMNTNISCNYSTYCWWYYYYHDDDDGAYRRWRAGV